MKRFLTIAFALVAVAQAGQPNILFIMSDDHTTQAIGAYGSRLAKLNPTPAIDELAKNGMRFDRVFCNNAICTPSRATIMTGQYSQTNGVLDLRGALLPKKHYLAQEMKKAGYNTAMIGKWHLNAEPADFDHYCVLPGQGKYFNPIFHVRGPKPFKQNVIKMDGKHSSDAITDLSLEWLANDWDREKPFFLMHHFKAPHDMFENAPRYDEYLANTEIPEPDNLRTPPPSGFGSGLTKGHEPWKLGSRLKVDQSLKEPAYSKAVYQTYLKRYLRCVKGVDDNVKRLIDYLKEIGEFENTVIIYTGDQGFFLGEHDLMDKRWMYEEAFRMPFIVHAPGIAKPDSSNDWLISNADFAPTMLELAGVETPAYMQGRSFAPALKGDARPADWREAIYYRYWMHMAHKLAVPAHFGIRTDRYKLIYLYGVDNAGKRPNTPTSWELYDLKNDPFENTNQYNNPEYAEIVAQLKKELKQLRIDLNETDAAYPEIQAGINAHWNDS